MKKIKIFKKEAEFDLSSIKTVKVKDINYLINKEKKTKEKGIDFVCTKILII